LTGLKSANVPIELESSYSMRVPYPVVASEMNGAVNPRSSFLDENQATPDLAVKLGLAGK
jgi:hypothetical protein